MTLNIPFKLMFMFICLFMIICIKCLQEHTLIHTYTHITYGSVYNLRNQFLTFSIDSDIRYVKFISDTAIMDLLVVLIFTDVLTMVIYYYCSSLS